MSLYQTTIRLRHHVRDARAIHRAIEHDAHGQRALWAQPEPRTLIIRTTQHIPWEGFPHAVRTTTTLTPDYYPAGQALTWALVANPTTSAHTGVGTDGAPAGRGIRTGIRDGESARAWVAAKLAPALNVDRLDAQLLPAAHGAGRLTLARWAFAGTGRATDPGILARLLTEGVGRGKAFGCGLLLVEAA